MENKSPTKDKKASASSLFSNFKSAFRTLGMRLDSQVSPPPKDENAKAVSPIKPINSNGKSARSSTEEEFNEETKKALKTIVIQTLLAMLARDIGGDDKTASNIFSHVYQQLVELTILPAYSEVEDETLSMKSLRERFHTMFTSVIATHKTDPTYHFDTTDYQQTFLINKESIKLLDTFSSDMKGYLSEPSRYLLEFKEIEKLGSGGFGSVYKAQNILDKMYYAVKKIQAKMNKEETELVKREVELLASLRHPNVVTYYSSWIEYQLVEKSESPEEVEITEIDLKSEPSSSSSLEICFESSRRTEGNGDSIAFSESAEPMETRSNKMIENDSESEEETESTTESSLKTEENDEESIIFSESAKLMETRSNKTMDPSSNETMKSRPNEMIENESESEEETESTTESKPSGVEHLLCLFITMELCHINLQTFLLDRNDPEKGGGNVDFEQSKNFFRQILEGVSYIHSNKIIHRDLKPQNIFLDENKTVIKIGDFGLARSIKSRSSSPTSEDQPLTPLDEYAPKPALLTERVGTLTYAAPEQQNSSDYDQKADMFSLGVICFELFYPFVTVAEKNAVLRQLKSNFGDIPDVQNLAKDHPLISEVILSLLNEDPAKRLSAEEVLKKIAGKSLEEMNKDLAYDIMINNQYIKELKSKNSIRTRIINNLERQNARLETFINQKAK